ncbi:FYVE zinc finger [Dictyocaulus viviparus]|uniref:FYVE zinc finger n=1 Tax=Dictyocaulus viviparus TaxID=29172 RepID=A0A0D8XA08_DICVI|nr:FYVE zinc finger [Dictyocaulus viviparus]
MVDRLVNSEVNARRVANVEQCFGKMAKPLSTFGRVLVGEGVLVKMCRKKPKRRQFFLFNDILVYGNIVISKKRYNKQRIIPLENVQLEDLPDEGGMKNGWIVKTPEKSFAVYAASPKEKKEWMIHIERCVADLIEKGNKRPAKEHAAVWIPDGEAARCMACGRTQFNLVQRRHHCRACGRVICGSCSTHSYRIDSLKKKPVRVCDMCFTRLTGVSNTMSPTTNGASALTRTLAPSPPSCNVEAGSESSSETDEEMTKDDVRLSNSSPTFYREDDHQNL